ncbi:hypothetical protein [Deefgea rivuli]|uniref:hypothetical protein n=1 Tax=Deefgea rivuli TaxID=400948 RepID=UPI0004816AFE|nr:hypothetical protein [Deefgea rivuli]
MTIESLIVEILVLISSILRKISELGAKDIVEIMISSVSTVATIVTVVIAYKALSSWRAQHDAQTLHYVRDVTTKAVARWEFETANALCWARNVRNQKGVYASFEYHVDHPDFVSNAEKLKTVEAELFYAKSIAHGLLKESKERDHLVMCLQNTLKQNSGDRTRLLDFSVSIEEINKIDTAGLSANTYFALRALR